MKSDNVSLKAAMRNTNDGISLIQTTEGSLNEVYNILTRMRELAVQGANDTYSSTDRTQIQIEFNQLRAEISRISTDTNFNRIGVLNSTKTLTFQIGINNASNNQFAIAMSTVSASLGALAIAGTDVSIGKSSSSFARAAITTIDTALSSVNDKRARLGAFQNRLESALNTASNYSQNLSSAASQISDVDYASESANMTKFQIMQQAGVAALGQAKAIPQSVLSLLG
jgi:flagellin